jgi:hypothetical protein
MRSSLEETEAKKQAHYPAGRGKIKIIEGDK